MKFNTKTIHAGQWPDPTTGSIMTPVYQTSTYIQKSPGDHKGYEYARTQNPTRDSLQRNLAELEGGKHGICFASGMAATDALIKTLKPGDEVIATNDLYGGTYRIFKMVYEKYGIKSHFVPMNNLEEVATRINPNTKILWIETPTNPMLNVVDIKGCADLAHAHNALLCVDNTFCSPYLQKPMEMGADIILHSATKYLGGHSDVILGAIVVSDDQLAEDLQFQQNCCGGVPGPWDCFLVLRGIKTLHVRMERHCENGNRIASFLQSHPKVGKVCYPGFEDHPGHTIAKKQMKLSL
ncbi:MAG TPA: aminotransferase class V-fold PLP-dependent enzyme [Flavobacteriales bacterium]|nr:aminotransferase class V-fold PLP-dependent enzyme [Flavobacteriales bacterium]